MGDAAILTAPLGSIRPFLCPTMPKWMREAVRGNIAEYDPHNGAPDSSRVSQADCSDASMMKTEPSYDGAALSVPRVRGLNASEFYRRFAWRGIPAVLEGALWHDGFPDQVTSIAECLADEYATKANAHGFASGDTCDRYNAWCRNGVQISSDSRCRQLAGFEGIEEAPPAIAALLQLPRPLPHAHELAERMSSPFLLWTPPGGEFGSTNHFDQLCANSACHGRQAHPLRFGLS